MLLLSLGAMAVLLLAALPGTWLEVLPAQHGVGRVATGVGLMITGVAMMVVGAGLTGLGAVVLATLSGVVFIERAGLRRCLRLVKGRFWATLGRMVAAGAIYVGYGIAAKLVVTLSLAPFGGAPSAAGLGSVAVHMVSAALSIPPTVYLLAVTLGSYAELRHHEDRSTSTQSLAAALTS